MLFYSPIHTPRVQYITDFIGRETASSPFELTSDRDLFIRSQEPKINYSPERITAEEYWVLPAGLLYEKTITSQVIECFDNNGQPAFFRTAGDWPFDIFAASFYLLSRYEEYLPHQKDRYGRYAPENSLAFRKGFLESPLINIWLKDFRKSLQGKFPAAVMATPAFRFYPTYDIDEAWSYKYKSAWRNAGGIVKAFLKGEWKSIGDRQKVRAGKKRDPFDSYEWMDELHRRYELNPRYFFLVPERTGKYDRNILPGEHALQDLIRSHAEKYSVGLHPSWQSGDDPSLLGKEKERLEKISGKKITSSRQHFIRFTLPETYRHLISAGIDEDFSMGYGSVNGFRASVASSFYWYDLQKEEITHLLLYPFCFMEANSFFEQNLTPLQALEEIKQLYESVRSVNGSFISIWHNTFLGTDPLFAGWKEVYGQFLNERRP